MEREVEALAARIRELDQERVALQSDPPYIERLLKREMQRLKPHLYQAQPLPQAIDEEAAGKLELESGL